MGDSYITEEEDAGETIRDRAYAMMDYIQSQIERGKRAGADFSEIESLLLGARMMIDSDSCEDAMELINQASQDAGQRIMDYEMLVKTIKKAEAEIASAEDAGKDTEDARKNLKMARYYLNDGNYKLGVSKAKAAVDSLTAKKEVEIAWGSGLW